MNIFKEMFLATWNFSAYKEFIKNKKRKIFLYALVLVMLHFIISSAAVFISFKMEFKSINYIIENYIPDFTLKDGKLHVDQKFSFNDNINYLAIDTDETTGIYPEFDSTSMQELLSSYKNVVIVDSDKMILKNNLEVQHIQFSDIKDKHFSKSDINWSEIKTIIKIIITILMVIIPIFMIIGFFFAALILAIVGIIASAVIGVKLRFGNLYTISIYSLTLPVIIKIIYSLVPVAIPFADLFITLINIFLPIVYIVIVLNMMSEELKAQAYMNAGVYTNTASDIYNNNIPVSKNNNNYSESASNISNKLPKAEENDTSIINSDTHESNSFKSNEDAMNLNSHKEDDIYSYTEDNSLEDKKTDKNESKDIIPSDGWSF